MGKKVLKIGGLALLFMALILIGAFSYISSGRFIQSQVLPRVADALGMEIEADDVSFSALSQLELKNLRVGDTSDPLLRAKTIRVQYHALSLLSRKVEINEVLLDGVTLSVTPEKLAALRQAAPAEKPAPETPAKKKPAKPTAVPEILVQNVSIKDMALNYEAEGATGPIAVQIPAFNLNLPLLAGGSDFHLALDTQVRVVSGDTLNAGLQNITLDLQGGLDANLMPTKLYLDVDVADITGSAGPVQLDGRRIQVALEMTGNAAHYDLKRAQLVEYNRETRDAELGVTGTLSIQPMTAALNLSANIPAGSLLDLVGALAGGLDFGQTAITYSGHFEMPAPGSVASRGELAVRDLTVAAHNVPALRPLQVAAAHDVAIDLDQHVLTLNRLDVNVADAGREVVGIKMEQPLQLDLQQPGGDAATRIAVNVTRLDLTMLNAFLASQPGVRILSGEVNRAVNIDIEKGGQQIVVDVGGGGIDNLVVQQEDRRIGPLRINHEARLQLDGFKDLNINHFKAELIPSIVGSGPAATLHLDGEMQLSPEPSGRINVALDGRCDRLLAVARPYIPPEQGVRKLVGTVNINGNVVLAGPDKPIRLEAESKLEGLDFALENGTRLATPLSSSLDLKLDYLASGAANLERGNIVLTQRGQPDPLLDLLATARFDTSMTPDVKNTVQLTAQKPVRLDALERLIVQPEKTEKAETAAGLPAPGTGEETPAAPPPNLWVEAGLSVGEAMYRQMDISNLVVNATYRKGRVDLVKAQAGVNGGTVNASGTCDLTNPDKPAYDLAIQSASLPFDPILASFVPKLPLRSSGGLKTADIRLMGDGFDLPSMQKSLTAQMDVQLDRFVVEEMRGAFGRLAETLLLGIFDLDISDLVFVNGGLKLAVDGKRYGDHDIHLEQLLMQAPLFMMDGSGTVQMGGKWTPDIEIKTGFSDGKANSLRSQGFSIASEKSASGYHDGPTIPLKGDLLSLRNQASIVTEVLVSAGKIRSEDALKADLANQLLSLFGGKDGEEKPDVGETVGNILQGVLGSQQGKKEQDTPKGDDATKVIGNVLKGIFGD